MPTTTRVIPHPTGALTAPVALARSTAPTATSAMATHDGAAFSRRTTFSPGEDTWWLGGTREPAGAAAVGWSLPTGAPHRHHRFPRAGSRRDPSPRGAASPPPGPPRVRHPPEPLGPDRCRRRRRPGRPAGRGPRGGPAGV